MSEHPLQEMPDKLPDMRNFRVDTDEGKQLLLEHTIGRLISSTHFPTFMLMMPLEVNGIFLRNGLYTLCGFSFAAQAGLMETVFDLNKLYAELKALIHEAFSHYAIHYVIEIDGMIVALCCCFLSPDDEPPNATAMRLRCLAACQDVASQWNTAHGDTLLTACGDPFEGVENIPRSLEKLQEYFHLKNYLSGENNHYIPDCSILPQLFPYAEQFVAAIEKLNLQKADDVVAQFLEMIQELAPLTMRDYYFRLHMFLMHLANHLVQRGLVNAQQRKQVEALFFPQKSIDIAEGLHRFAAAQIELKSYRDASTVGTMITAAKQYIQDNIHSQNLSVASLSEYLGTSASTVSTRFKRFTGVRLIDYIHQVRLQYARQLLEETDQSVTSVAEAAGYGNVSTMYRAFQKELGVSPANVRRATQKDSP